MSITAKDAPRGIRNHNPGNIEYKPNTQWQGLDAAKPSDGRFCRFKDPVYGIRAIAVTLITYQDKRRAADGSRIDTVREIIDRWAPPNENNTNAYVASVRKRLGLNGAEAAGEVDVHRFDDCMGLVKAIIQHENGQQPYTDAQVEKALRLAGVEPAAPKSLQESRTIKGSQIAAGSTVASAVLAGAEQAADYVPAARTLLDFVRDYQSLVMLGLAAAALIGIGYVVYAKWDDRRKGIA